MCRHAFFISLLHGSQECFLRSENVVVNLMFGFGFLFRSMDCIAQMVKENELFQRTAPILLSTDTGEGTLSA